MDRSPNLDVLTGLLVDLFEVEHDTVTPASTFQELGLNSLALVELLVVAERELGLDLSDFDIDLDPGLTVATVVEHLDRIPAAAPAPVPAPADPADTAPAQA